MDTQIMTRELIRELREKLDRAQRQLDQRAAFDRVRPGELEGGLSGRLDLQEQLAAAERERDEALNEAARLRKFADTLTDQIRAFPSFTDVALLLSPGEALSKCKERASHGVVNSDPHGASLTAVHPVLKYEQTHAVCGRTENEATQLLELCTRALESRG